MTDLVARLREANSGIVCRCPCKEAADRIEALEKQVDDVTWTALTKRIEALEAALRKVALAQAPIRDLLEAWQEAPESFKYILDIVETARLALEMDP